MFWSMIEAELTWFRLHWEGKRTSLWSCGGYMTTSLKRLISKSLLLAQNTACLTLNETQQRFLKTGCRMDSSKSILRKECSFNITCIVKTQTSRRRRDARERDKNWLPAIAWSQRRCGRKLRRLDSFAKYLTSLLIKLKHCQFSYVLKIGCTFLSVNFDALRFYHSQR